MTIRSIISGAAAVFLLAGSAFGQALTGSGSHLAIPAPNPGAPANQPRAITTGSGGFTGTWTPPALAPWVGTFSASGPIPGTTSNPPGVTLYDFTSLPTGALPSGTYFRFGDVDTGSATTEQFILHAFDSNGQILSPWLDVPIGVSGTGISSTSMPGWSFDALSGGYTIDGTSVTSNPNVAVYLPNNTAITTLEVQRTSEFSSFSLHAPVPSPATLSVLAAGPVFARRRRR